MTYRAITVRIHRNENDDNGLECRLYYLPRVGETVSIPDDDGIERDVTVTKLNHWIKWFKGSYQQVEVVIFCKPTTTIN